MSICMDLLLSYICAWYITTATCFIYTIVYIWQTQVMHVYIVYATQFMHVPQGGIVLLKVPWL